MRIGIPTEVKNHEYRVAATPEGVRELTHAGHTVIVQAGAGLGSAIPDERYVAAGASIGPDADAVFADADLIVKVKEPQSEEYERFRSDHLLFTYLHLAADERLTRFLAERRRAGRRLRDGAAAGRPAAAARADVGDRRPDGAAGGREVPRAAAGRARRADGRRQRGAARDVVVLGGGMAGWNAAEIAAGMQAEVIVVDKNVDRLREIDRIWRGRIQTVMSSRLAVEGLVLRADLVVGAVLVPGAKAPHLVSAEQVARDATGRGPGGHLDRPGRVLRDVARDDARRSDVRDRRRVHYCVGNMPGAVPRTSTYALTNVTLPYVLAIAGAGVEQAVRDDPALALGVNTWDGAVTNGGVAAATGVSATPLASIVG